MTEIQKIIFGIKEGMEKLGELVKELDRQTNPKGSWEKPKHECTSSCGKDYDFPLCMHGKMPNEECDVCGVPSKEDLVDNRELLCPECKQDLDIF